MAVSLTNQQILQSLPALQRVGKLKLPPRKLFELSKILGQLKEAVRLFEATRISLAEQHAEREESGATKYGENTEIKLANPVEFHKGVQELLTFTTDFDCPTVSFDLFQLLGTAPEADDLEVLSWLIVE